MNINMIRLLGMFLTVTLFWNCGPDKSDAVDPAPVFTFEINGIHFEGVAKYSRDEAQDIYTIEATNDTGQRISIFLTNINKSIYNLNEPQMNYLTYQDASGNTYTSTTKPTVQNGFVRLTLLDLSKERLSGLFEAKIWSASDDALNITGAFEHIRTDFVQPPSPCDNQGGDTDNDGVCDDVDNCPNTANADQADADNDGIGDVCDTTMPPPPTDDFLTGYIDGAYFEADSIWAGEAGGAIVIQGYWKDGTLQPFLDLRFLTDVTAGVYDINSTTPIAQECTVTYFDPTISNYLYTFGGNYQVGIGDHKPMEKLLIGTSSTILLKLSNGSVEHTFTDISFSVHY